MTQEPALNEAGRRKVRKLILQELAWATPGVRLKDWIEWTYRDMPKRREYAHAMVWALETGDPLNITAGRGT